MDEGRLDGLPWVVRLFGRPYLVKPFSPTELTARVEAALRRVTRPSTTRTAG